MKTHKGVLILKEEVQIPSSGKTETFYKYPGGHRCNSVDECKEVIDFIYERCCTKMKIPEEIFVEEMSRGE